MREEDKPIDRTVVKIRTKENMYYTFMEFPWEEIKHDENCKHFIDIRAYAKYLAQGKIQDIVFNTDNNLIYLYPENKAISRDNIKEVYVEETIALRPEN